MTLPMAFAQRPGTVAIAMTIGAFGMLVLGIQPLMLEAMLAANLLTATQIGWVATTEVLATALGVIVGARLLHLRMGRAFIVGFALLMAAVNLATLPAQSAFWILLARTVAGLAEGVMVSVAVLSITYGRAPGRLNAIFLTVAAIPQVGVAYMLPAYLQPLFGQKISFAILTMAGVLCALIALMTRDRFAPEARASSVRIEWSWSVILVLGVTILTAAAVGSCWGYAGAIGAEIGLTPQQVGIAVTCSLISQVLGSLIVALVGYRLPFRAALIGGTILQVLSSVALLYAHAPLEFTVALCIFGMLWTACSPYATDLIIAADASRATAPLILPLMFVGLSVGPLVASFWVGQSLVNAFAVGMVGFLLALVLYSVIFLRTLRVVPSLDISR